MKVGQTCHKVSSAAQTLETRLICVIGVKGAGKCPHCWTAEKSAKGGICDKLPFPTPSVPHFWIRFPVSLLHMQPFAIRLNKGHSAPPWGCLWYIHRWISWSFSCCISVAVAAFSSYFIFTVIFFFYKMSFCNFSRTIVSCGDVRTAIYYRSGTNSAVLELKKNKNGLSCISGSEPLSIKHCETA